VKLRVLRTFAPILAGAFGAIGFVACTSLPKEEAFPVWPPPPAEARVRLERIVADADGAGRGFFSGASRQSKPSLFERPFGVAWDGPDLIVADPAARRILRIPPTGSATKSPDGLLGEPMGVAVTPEGIAVTDSRAGEVLLVGRDLKSKRLLLGDLVRPTGIAYDGARLYVLETGRHLLRIRDANGTWRQAGGRGEGGGEFNFPAALAAGNGRLLVGDTLNFRIQKIDPVSGRALGAFGQLGDSAGEMPRIKGVAVDSAGHVWVSDALLDQVAIYAEDGTYLLSIGSQGAAPGQFSFPAGLAASGDGRVAVVDSLGRRIQVFKILTEGRTPR
jgi:DNA-binding beta-propeller fold protein YncE